MADSSSNVFGLIVRDSFRVFTVLRRAAVAINELIALKDKLSRDPFFRALFHKADSAQAAISMASAFDVCLSLEGVFSISKGTSPHDWQAIPSSS